MTPKQYGGSELGLGALISTSSLLAEYCASTAWVYQVLAGHNWLLSLFHDDAQQEIFASANPLTASCTRAVGDIRRISAGVRLQNAQGRFCSGIDHAGWIAIGAGVANDSHAEQCFIIVPTNAVEIVDDWRTTGMRGTGSKSFTISDLVVPERRVLRIKDVIDGAAPGLERNSSPIYRAPFPQILPYQLVGVPLGIAKASLATFIELKKTAMKAISPTELGEHTPTYLLIAEAGVEIEAANAIIDGDCALIDDIGEPVSTTALNRSKYVRNVAYSVQKCRAAVNRLYEASGGSGLYDSHPMQRLWRDMNSAAAHAAFQPERGGTMFGRSILNLPPSPRYKIGQ